MHTRVEREEAVLSRFQGFLFIDQYMIPCEVWFSIRYLFQPKDNREKGVFGDQVETITEIGYIRMLACINMLAIGKIAAPNMSRDGRVRIAVRKPPFSTTGHYVGMRWSRNW